MPRIEHGGIDVLPQLAQMGDVLADTLLIRALQRGHLSAHARAAASRRGRPVSPAGGAILQRGVLGLEGLYRHRVQRPLKQVEAAHGIFGIAGQLPVGRGDPFAREVRAQRGTAHQQGHAHPRGLQVLGRDHHLLRTLDQQAGQPDGVGMLFPARFDQLFRRNLDA